MYKCCIEILVYLIPYRYIFQLHMYKCCIEIPMWNPWNILNHCFTCTNVVLKFAYSSFACYFLILLHMYKCCIEMALAVQAMATLWGFTCTNVVLKWCKIQIYKKKFFGFTCTNVVLKFVLIFVHDRGKPMLHMYKCCIEIYKIGAESAIKVYASHVQMLYWNYPYKELRYLQTCFTCTNVVLKSSAAGFMQYLWVSFTCTNVVLKYFSKCW